MSQRISAHLRSNIVGYIALFCFAIGGTAYATHPGGDNTIDSGDIINQQVLQQDIAAEAVGTDQIKNNQVRSPDIKTGEVQTTDILDGDVGLVDLAANSVDSGKVVDNSLLGADISNAPPFGSGGLNGDVEIIDGTVTQFDIGASQVSGFHVADDTLGGADINESTLATNNVSNSATSSGCTADVHVDTVCASVGITLPYGGNIVANASGAWHSFNLDDLAGDDSGTDDTTRVVGSCDMRLDGGGSFIAAQNMGEDVNAGNGNENHPSNAAGTLSLTGRTGAAAGAHTVTVVCREFDGDLDWSPINVSVQGTN